MLLGSNSFENKWYSCAYPFVPAIINVSVEFSHSSISLNCLFIERNIVDLCLTVILMFLFFGISNGNWTNKASLSPSEKDRIEKIWFGHGLFPIDNGLTPLNIPSILGLLSKIKYENVQSPY